MSDETVLVDRVHAAVVELRASRGLLTGPDQRSEAEAAVQALGLTQENRGGSMPCERRWATPWEAL